MEPTQRSAGGQRPEQHGPTRRQFLAGVGATGGVMALSVTGCAPPGPTPHGCGPSPLGPALPLPAPGSAGLLDEAAWQARAGAYLAGATEQLDPTNPVSVALHLLRARRDASFGWDPTAVTVESFGPVWDKLDAWLDTGDFTLMELHWVRALGLGVLDPAVIEAIDRRLVEFRYRYDDPLPADRVDHKWFWSENHRVIFAVIEHLSGLALPEEVFAITQMTGAQHAARGRARILDWVRERARYGFSEWHSNVYMVLNVQPLLTVLELCPADDVELQLAAACGLDLCLLDVAAHLHRGVYGATRGRTYEKDKMTARDENTFLAAHLLFDDTRLGDGSDPGVAYRPDGTCMKLVGAERYRMPELLVRIAKSREVGTVLERHGLPLDPSAPVTPWPAPIDGHGFGVDEVEFWWSQGALTAWQNVPATLRVADRFRLWDSDLFRSYRALRVASKSPALAQLAARELAPVTAAGVLGEPHTVTWRSPEVMLSTVVDHRPGAASEQNHSWQATVDADALVFTTHPTNPPGTDGRGEDSGYWTGNASAPRSAQHDRVAIHCYLPGYQPLDLSGIGFEVTYLQMTHAFFPQERFDEVVQQAGWTVGRRGDGYIALWSARQTEWRHGPVISSVTFDEPFDLVADGDARNVWICEVGRQSEWPSFAAFVDSVTAAPVEASLGRGGWTVRYTSPTAGSMRFGSAGPLTVGGAEVPLRGFPRHRSAWGEICHRSPWFELTDPADGGARLAQDVDSFAREVR